MFARFVTTTALVLSTLAVSPAAQAQTASIRVNTADLATDAGHKAAIVRIERAARSACGYGRSLDEIVAARKCTKELSAVMIENLASAQLALQTGRNGTMKVASR